MHRRKSKQILPEYNSSVRDLLKLLFHMNRYFQRLSLRANTLIEMATVNHSILYFHRSCPDENYRMYLKRQERQQEHLQIEHEMMRQEMCIYDDERFLGCIDGGGSSSASGRDDTLPPDYRPPGEGDNYSMIVVEQEEQEEQEEEEVAVSTPMPPPPPPPPPPPSSSNDEECDYRFDTNIRTLEDIELIEENCRLRMCLEDYERGVEMIMHKLREQFERNVLQEEFVLRDMADNNLWDIIGKQREMKSEMAAVMRESAATSDPAHLENVETLSYLMTENKSLRELLLISKEYGTYQQPIRYNEYYRVDAHTQTDITIKFEGFVPPLGEVDAAAHVAITVLDEPTESENSSLTPSNSLTSLTSVISAESSRSTSSNTSVVSVREIDVTACGVASDEDDADEWTGVNCAGDGAGDALDNWAGNGAYEEAVDEPCDEAVDGVYNEAALLSLCITGTSLMPPPMESSELNEINAAALTIYDNPADCMPGDFEAVANDGDQLVGIQMVPAPANAAVVNRGDDVTAAVTLLNELAGATTLDMEGSCQEKLVLAADELTHRKPNDSEYMEES